MLNLFLIQSLNGLQYGVLLFLIAGGLTLIFGIMDLINLAHGAFYMVGAYMSATLVAITGNFFLGIALALPATMLFGILLEFLLFRWLYERSHLEQVLATFGLILIVDEAVKMIWGSAPIGMAIPEFLSGSVPLAGSLRYPLYRLIIIAAGILTALGLYFLVNKTRVGMLLRAGAVNPSMVSALGVDIGRLFTVVFGLGTMLAGFAGALVAPVLSVDPSMGDSILILAFVVIVVGGVGSVKGAFFAGIIIGLVDTLARSFGPVLLRSVMEASAANQTGRTLAPMLIYLLMALILYFRPTGLFRQAGRAA